jgi:2-polyprenyl-6-methoxyphenol hydroxylase-like FAD-dependent oxidoreductase
MNGDHPPTDVEGFADFAASLPIPQIHRLVETHPRVWEDIEYYPFPSNRRVRYENLDGFPDGLIVLGDAIASFNPIYGQGMSVAALEALVLHHVLASGSGPNLALAFFDRIQTIVDTAWTMAIGADVQFPETTGPTPPGAGMFAWYLSRLTRKAHADGELRDALASVASMEYPPTRLLRPAVAWKVLKPEILRGGHTDHAPPKGDPRRTS